MKAVCPPGYHLASVRFKYSVYCGSLMIVYTYIRCTVEGGLIR